MRINMIGWEFPTFVSGGLGVHCFELVTRLERIGISVNFFMPKTKHEILKNNLNIIEVGNRKTIYKTNFVSVGNVFDNPIDPYMSLYDHVQRIEGTDSVLHSLSEKTTLPLEGVDFFDKIRKYNELAVLEAVDYDCDVIHCHDWITYRAGVKLKKITGKPLVITVHSTEYDRTANIYPWQWIIDIEKEGMDHADRIIAVSRHTKNVITEKYGISPDKITVVYNGIDHAKFSEGVRKTIDTDDKIILFLGRLTNQKGPKFFLRAAKKVLEKRTDVKFVIAGKGHILPELISEAIKLGIMQKVLFAGFVPDEEIQSLYAVSDCYVLPSVSEPFGITALEAMASGVPTIVSKTSGVSEIAKNCMKVDFWDTGRMAKMILGILNYPVLRNYMGELSQKESKKHSWEKTASGTSEVYNKVVSGQ